MAKKITDQDDLKVIEMVTDQVTILTNDHWLEIQKARKDNDGMIAVNYQVNLDYNGEERAIETKISFTTGRVKDTRRDVVNPNQPDLPNA